MSRAAAALSRLACAALAAAVLATPAAAAETLNAYSIWPENWARPMLQEFEQATGIKWRAIGSDDDSYFSLWDHGRLRD